MGRNPTRVAGREKRCRASLPTVPDAFAANPAIVMRWACDTTRPLGERSIRRAVPRAGLVNGLKVVASPVVFVILVTEPATVGRFGTLPGAELGTMVGELQGHGFVVQWEACYPWYPGTLRIPGGFIFEFSGEPVPLVVPSAESL